MHIFHELRQNKTHFSQECPQLVGEAVGCGWSMFRVHIFVFSPCDTSYRKSKHNLEIEAGKKSYVLL